MRWRRPIRRRFAAELGSVAASGLLVAVAAGVPWHRSGDVRRTGFELARAADRAGLVTGAGSRALLVAVLLLPLLAGGVLLAAAAGRQRLAGLLTCGAAAVGLASAAVVARLPGGRQPGPLLAAVVGAVAVGCGVLLSERKGSE